MGDNITSYTNHSSYKKQTVMACDQKYF